MMLRGMMIVVNVDLPFSTCLFLLVDIDLPFSNWSTCLFLTGRRSTSIDAHRRIDVRQRPFSALFITPFQGLFCAKKLVSLICLRLLLLMAHLHIRFGNYFFVFVLGCSLGWTVLSQILFFMQ